jgi:hypothetical protein
MSNALLARLLALGTGVALQAICPHAGWATQVPAQLDDTGMTQCAVFDGARQEWVLTARCKGTGQDPVYGRDATDPSGKDGRAGFSFVKIGDDGEALPRRALSWRCVLDNVTGLMWEVKTADGSLFDYRNRYTNVGDGSSGDASGYVATVNSVGLCGANDWRLPSRGELESLLDYSHASFSPMVDADWFPNTLGALHWTSTSSEVNGGAADYWWSVDFFAGATMWRNGAYDSDPVRLVRGGVPAPAKRWRIHGAAGDEVLDKQTRLIWRRCAEGRTWTGTTCSGSGSVFLTGTGAIAHALEERRLTGQPWRAPNIKELSTLVDTDVNFPAIDPSAFPAFESDLYHTGTFWTQNPVYSWRVSFARGEMMTDFSGGRLLLVRDAGSSD